MKITITLDSDFPTTITRDFGDGKIPDAIELSELFLDVMPMVMGWNNDKVREFIDMLEQERDENMKEYTDPLPRSMSELDDARRGC